MMKKYKISWSYGYVGTHDEDVIEAESLEDAQEQAWEIAIQQVESHAEEIEEGDDSDDRTTQG